jgi:hypothetical protein
MNKRIANTFLPQTRRRQGIESGSSRSPYVAISKKRVSYGLLLLLAVTWVFNPFHAYAAIGYRGVTTGENGAGSTSVSIAMPTGTVQNDVMIAIMASRAGTGTITPPSGWTQINTTNSTTTIMSSTFYKVAGSGEAGPYVFSVTSSKAAGIIASYSGVDTTTPIDAQGMQANASNTVMTAPSISPVTSNTWLVGAYSNATGTTFAAGSSMSLRGQTTSSGGGSAGTKITVGMQDLSISATGATGTKTMTATSGAINTGHLIALRPAATTTQASYRLFQNTDSTTASTPYAATNTAATIAQDTPFRLRIGIGADSGGGPIASGTQYKLQYAEKVGTCDVSFSGETYADVSTSSRVSFYDNTTPADGAAYVTSANDPTRSGITAIGQKYNESNPLTVGTSIPANQDGLWDMALKIPSVYQTPWVDGPVGAPYTWTKVVAYGDGTKAVGIRSGVPIVQTTNTGASWSNLTNSPSLGWTGIAVSSDGTKMYGSVNGGLLRASTDSGATWNSLANSPSVYWYDVASSSDGAKLVGVTSAGVYTSTDSGANWTLQTSTVFKYVASSADGTKLVAASDSGTVYTSTNSGVNWTSQANSGSRTWKAVATSSDGTKLAAVASADYVYTSTDSGVTWSAKTAAGNRLWTGVGVSSDAATIVATSTTGGAYISRDSGATWVNNNPSSSSLYTASVSSDGTKLYVGSNAYLHSSTIAVNPSTASYCMRIVSSSGATLGTYTQLPEILPPPPVVTQANYRWFANADSATPGSPLAAQDTAATVAPDTVVRLRQRLAVDTAALSQSATTYKLQYSPKVGTCDVGFSGETYTDMNVSGGTTSPSTLSATTAVNDPSYGTTAWTNTAGAITGNDTSYAQTNSPGSTGTTNSQYLKLSNFGFTIPANATITGVKATFAVQSDALAGGISGRSSAKLVKGGTATGTDKGNTSWTASTTTDILGSSSDLWGTTLTPADINASNFGVAIAAFAAYDDFGATTSYAYVDAVTLDIYFTVPSSSPLQYFNNTTAADVATIASTGNDPINGARPMVYQSYRETDPFTNNVGSIAAGSDGLWDFSLKAAAAAAGNSYCLRVVNTSNALLDTYSQIAELAVSSGGSGPTLDQQMRGGNSVVAGTKGSLTW